MKFPGWGYWRAAPSTGNERLRVALRRACANRGRDIGSDSPHPRSRSDIKWGTGDRRWGMAAESLFAPSSPHLFTLSHPLSPRSYSPSLLAGSHD
jgi:hypothetical protein